LATRNERALHASEAGHTSWANTDDPTARTEPGRRTFMESFERQVDPDGTMDPVERARRAEHLRSAHFARLALKSAQARREKRNTRRRKGADQRDVPINGREAAS
jgi:hypothetical protein